MSGPLPFTFDDAQRHAQQHITRRGGESIDLFQLRLDKAANNLMYASREPGNPLHRFLTRFHVLYPPATRAAELALLTRDALLADTPVPVAPDYTLAAMRAAG
ncbi:MAG: hypothetical protein WA961_14615 [Rhodanobacter sp.]